MDDSDRPGDPGPVRMVRLVSVAGAAVVGFFGLLLVLIGGFFTSTYLFPAVLSDGVTSHDGLFPESLVATLACLLLAGLGFFLAAGLQREERPGQQNWGLIVSGIAFWVAGGIGLSGRGAFRAGAGCGAVDCWPGWAQDGLIGAHILVVGMVAILAGLGWLPLKARRYAPTVALVAALGLYHFLWIVFLRDFFLGPGPAWYSLG